VNPTLAPDRERLITPPFLVVTLSTFAYFLFVGMLNPVLPVFVEDDLGGGGVAIGAQVAAFSLAAIGVRPVIGLVGDRAGRRVLMLAGALLSAVSGAALAGVDTLALLLVLRAVTGVGEAALFVGAATLIADLSPPHRRAEGTSYFSVAVFAGLGLGPLLGEGLSGDGRFDRAFLVAALFALVSMGIALGAPHGRPVDRSESLVPSPAPRRRLVHPAAVGPGLVLAAGVAALTTFLVFVPTYVDELGMAGASGVFLLYSMVSLVIRAGFATLPERLGLRRASTVALVCLAVAGALAAAWSSPVGLYSATVLIALGTAFLYPSLLAAAVAPVSDDERSQVVSGFTMFFEVGAVVGGLALGPLVALSDERAAFAGGGVLALAGLVAVRRWVQDSVPTPPVRPLDCV